MKCAEDSEGAREAAGDCGDRGWLGHREPCPHVKEGGGVAIGAAQVDVLAAGVGEHGAEFGVGHGAEEREKTADDPREVNEHGRACVLHHFAGDEEDAAADDGADDDGGGLAGAKDAGQVSRNCVCRRGGDLAHAVM